MTAVQNIKKMAKFLRRNKQPASSHQAEVSKFENTSQEQTVTEVSEASLLSLPCEEGKFFSQISPMDGHHSISDCSEMSACLGTPPASWKSTEQKGYHKHAPLVAQPLLVAQEERGANLNPSTSNEEMQNLRIAMKRAAELPRNSYFTSYHVMVNREREKRKVPYMNRSRELDELARWHVESMAAASEGAFHADATELLARLQKPCRRIGSNVGVGGSIQDMHSQMMRNRSMFNNIVDRRYAEMGMATAKGQNGELYICQIFRG